MTLCWVAVDGPYVISWAWRSEPWRDASLGLTVVEADVLSVTEEEREEAV
jgi:hypothetical protein